MAENYIPFGFTPPRFSRMPPTPNALMPQTEAERADLASQPNIYNLLAEMSGMGAQRRAGNAFSQGRPWEGIANAGVAAMPFRPALGFAGLGTGYGGALASDLGLFSGPTPATAQAPTGIDPQKRIGELDKDIAKVTKDLETLARKIKDPDLLYTRSQPATMRLQQLNEERSRMQAMLGTASANTSAEEARKRKQEQEEEARSFERAEAARTRERARDTRFEDTQVGQVWSSTGGLAPMALGGLTGAIQRAARPRSFALPLAEGTLGGALAYNIPLGFNAFGTPFENPERRAQEAYARELPLGNPVRQKTEEYARTLPVENPLRRAASEEFYNPMHAAERMAFGAGEGLLGASLGVGGVEIGGRVRRALQNRAGPSSPGAPLSPAPPAPPAPVPPAPSGLASLGAQRPAQPLAPEAPPPAPRGTRQAEGPPEGAVWNPLTQRWHLGNRIVGGSARWPAPPRRDWRDYPDE